MEGDSIGGYNATGYYFVGRLPREQVVRSAELISENPLESQKDFTAYRSDVKTILGNVELDPPAPEHFTQDQYVRAAVKLLLDRRINPIERN